MGRHLLLQLSDIHLVPAAHLRSIADPVANLDRALELVASSPCRPEGVLLTGDLTDTGDPAGYVALRERIERLTSTAGSKAVYVPGNHDDRAAVRRYLLSATDGGAPDDPIDQVHSFTGLRVISMDTTVPGSDAGALSGAQLDWLRQQLEEPAPDGTVLALHHPPIGSPIEPMARLALAAPERLHDAITGTDVCLIVAGHNHHASFSMLGSVPVWVSPALAYRSDALVSAEYTPRTGCSFTRIDVIDGRPLVTVVPVPPD